ncbi:hypothetical protein [Polaribacter aestuariivivens]|uniref:hypothetical protein n=1 Tax=Polaribacter aestuariivivens TaxID=2304626 RepID=UPI003F493E78
MKNALQITTVLAMVMQVLSFHANRLPVEFKQNLDQANIKVIENVNIIRKEVAVGSGTEELIDANTKKIRGVSDYIGNTLPDNTVQIITEIKVGYDASQTASGKEGSLSYGSDLSSTVRNARLVIKQDGNVIFTMPISQLNNPNTGTNNTDDFTQLAIPVVLVPNQTISFDIEFPVGGTPNGTNKEYFELALRTFETRRSAA